MKTLALTLAVILLSSAAKADNTINIDMSGTSPAAASTTTVAYTTPTELGTFTTCSGYAVLQGGTGGTLDVFIQTAYRKINATPVWADVAHFTQLTAGNAAVAYAFTLTRFNSTGAGAPTAGLNTVSDTPALTANTVVPGVFGYLFRVVYKTGAGNTAGAAQSILISCSST